MLLRSRDTAVSLAAAVLLATALLPLSRRAASGMGADRPYDFVHVPDGRGLRLLSPGLRLSVANLYWLSAVQYVGERHGKERGYGRLFPVVDLVTDLDPRHGYAYQSAGIFLSSVEELDGSDRIFEKGYRRGPGWWSFPYYLAFNAVFYRHDYDAAARWAEAAARTPGAPPLAAELATTMRMKSGSPDDAVRMLDDLRVTVKDEKTAEALESQYRLAVLQRDVARLEAAVARFRAERGAAPSSLDEVVRAGFLAAIPPEPYGGRYLLDRRDGSVRSSVKDLHHPMPPAPGGAPPRRQEDR